MPIGVWGKVIDGKTNQDCSGDGVSAHWKELFVVDVAGQYVDLNKDTPLVQIKKVGDSPAAVVIYDPRTNLPGHSQSKKTIGPMFGGRYLNVDGVVYRLHDRFETPEDYNRLCD